MYAISFIVGTVVLLMLSSLLAYLIYPLVELLQRRLPHPLAIAVAYLLVAGFLAVGVFIVVSSLIRQLSALAQSIKFLLSPAGGRQTQSILDYLGKLGISKDQVTQVKNQLFSQALGAFSWLLPFLTGLFSNVIGFISVVTLSVYFAIDGPRIIRWLSIKTPATRRDTINFLLHALDESLGGYCRRAGVAACPLRSFIGSVFLSPLLSPGDRFLGDRSAVYPSSLSTGLGDDAHRRLLYDVSPGGCHWADTGATHLQQSSWGSSHRGLFRALRRGELFGLLGGLLSVPVADVLQ